MIQAYTSDRGIRSIEKYDKIIRMQPPDDKLKASDGGLQLQKRV